MGIYLFNRTVLDTFDTGSYIDFPTIVMNLVRDEKPVKVYLSENEWLDIGRPDDYAEASERFQEIRDQFLPSES